MSLEFLLSRVDFEYPGASRAALSSVDLEVRRGTLHAFLGPNGSGKSTLLRVMLGELGTTRGTVHFRDRPIQEWKRRDVALQAAFVPQSEPLAFPMTVRALVEMGRYPHVGALGRATPEDLEAVESAMRLAGVLDFSDRAITTLSGGERQRARIARALAQQPDTMVLDEPTAALDMRFEMETFELMRRLTEEEGITIVVATHNLNLASRYATDVLLLAEGAVRAAGAPRDVYSQEILESVYQWPVQIEPLPGSTSGGESPQVFPVSARPPNARS